MIKPLTKTLMRHISIFIATIVYGEYLTKLEQENIIEQEKSEIISSVSKFETEILETPTLLGGTAKEDSVVNTPPLVQINSRILQGLVQRRNEYGINLASEHFYVQGKNGCTFAIATPLKSESSEFVGIFAGLVNLDFWNKRFAEIDLAKNENVIVIDHDGNISNSKRPALDTVESFDHVQSINIVLTRNSSNAVKTINGASSFLDYVLVLAMPRELAPSIIEPYEDTFSSVKLIRFQYTSIAIAMSEIADALYLSKGSTKNILIFPQKIRQIKEDISELSSPVKHQSSRDILRSLGEI